MRLEEIKIPILKEIIHLILVRY